MEHTAHHWIGGFVQLCKGTLDTNAFAKKLTVLSKGKPITTEVFYAHLRSQAKDLDVDTSDLNTNLTRGEACQILYDTYFTAL